MDDGSTDDGPRYARSLGARVIPSGGTRLGPARARNVGAREALGAILVFVDADVVVHGDTLRSLVGALSGEGTCSRVAVYGSYDDSPPERAFSSRYMNLRHHFYHRLPLEDSPTFWSGLGAVRREAFLAVGGFDTETFERPSVEDVELGHRLREAGGRILRDPAIQATHLKRWSFGESLRTDVLMRALPWARLMVRNPGRFGDLNVAGAERVRAVLAGALLLASGLAGGGVAPAWVPALLLVLAIAVNHELLLLFVRRGGLFFGLAALLRHQLYYLYSAAVFVFAKLEGILLGGARQPDA